MKLGVAEANCLDRAVKSESLLTESPETETRPKVLSACASKKLTSSYLTIVVCLLEVHIDDSTRPDFSHLVAVNCPNLSEFTGLDSVATILGKECRDGVVGEFESSLIISGLSVGRITTPRVDVVAPEIDGRVSITTVEIMSQINSDVGIIVGSITNTDGAVALSLNVSLHVTDGSFNESTGVSVVDIVGDFVTGKETEDVCVVGHGTEI